MSINRSKTIPNDESESLIQRNIEFYSKCNSELISYLHDHKEEIDIIAKNVRQELKDDYFGDGYDVSAWPLVLNASKTGEFKSFVKTLPNIIDQAMNFYFSDDIQVFAEYFNEPATTLTLMRSPPQKEEIFIARHDIVFSNGKLKLLEINAGCNLGGMELDWMHLKALEATKKLPIAQKYKLRYRKIFPALLDTIAQAVATLDKEGKTGNILFSGKSLPHEVTATLAQFLLGQYKESQFYQQGKVFLCSDYNQVVFEENDQVSYEGHQIDAVVMMEAEDFSTIKNELTASYMTKKIVFPDSPAHRLLGSKLLLALLHEPKVKDSLTDEERKWIDRHIPWTAKFNQQHVTWHGHRYQVDELLKQEKNNLVLKKSVSMQGRDVFIGKYTSEQEWQHTIYHLEDEKDWIIQEYCSPDNIIVSDTNSNLRTCTPVWGVFDFNHDYRGSFIRVTPVDFNNSGVINCAAGAMVVIVLEDATPARKLVL